MRGTVELKSVVLRLYGSAFLPHKMVKSLEFMPTEVGKNMREIYVTKVRLYYPVWKDIRTWFGYERVRRHGKFERRIR